MAAHAVTHDISFTLRGVAHHDVRKVVGTAIGDVFDLLMKKLSQIDSLLFESCEKAGIPFSGRPILKEGNEMFAVVIGENDV